MTKARLMTPGPVEVPPEVMLEMARPITHHRTAEFRTLLGEVVELVQYVLQTKNDVFVLTSSGSGAMEAALVNTCPPGSKAIAVVAGKFGERWRDLCKAFGVECIELDVEWGHAVDPALIEKTLAENPDVQAVFLQHSETSTGCAVDLEAIGKVVAKTDAILVADCITSAGALELRCDQWSVDIAVTGSQKAFMLPPGLGFISVSPKAWAKIDANEKPACLYFDLKAYRKSMTKSDTPYTPANTLILAAKKALSMIKKTGIENVWIGTKTRYNALRAGCEALGLTLFAADPSFSVVTIKLPESIDGIEFTKLLQSKFGVKVAGGQAHLKGRIFRVSTMGFVDPLDCLAVMGAIELTLSAMDHPIDYGQGLAAAEKALVEG